MNKVTAISTPGTITVENHRVFVTYGVRTTDQNRVVLARDITAARQIISLVDGVDPEEVSMCEAKAVLTYGDLNKVITITTPGTITVEDRHVLMTYGDINVTTDENIVILGDDIVAAQQIIAQIDGVDFEEVSMWHAESVLVQID